MWHIHFANWAMRGWEMASLYDSIECHQNW